MCLHKDIQEPFSWFIERRCEPAFFLKWIMRITLCVKQSLYCKRTTNSKQLPAFREIHNRSRYGSAGMTYRDK